MPAIVWNAYIEQGATFEAALFLADLLDAPIDLDGYSAVMTALDEHGGEELFSISTDDGGITITNEALTYIDELGVATTTIVTDVIRFPGLTAAVTADLEARGRIERGRDVTGSLTGLPAAGVHTLDLISGDYTKRLAEGAVTVTPRATT